MSLVMSHAKSGAQGEEGQEGGRRVGDGGGRRCCGEPQEARRRRRGLFFSTQCRQFNIRALKVEDLESVVPGVSVIINPEKPCHGCLEIREEGGEVFISLLNMPLPFTAMKKLDMDEVKDIAKKIS